jgi:hypothetical protein
MWSLIQLLIYGHTHKWETMEHGYTDKGSRYVLLECKKCGVHKIETLYATSWN